MPNYGEYGNLSQIRSNLNIGTSLDGMGLEVPSERRVLQEMKQQGMATPALVGEDSIGQSSALEGRGFMDVLKDSMEKVNEHQAQADTAIKEMVSGRNKNIHETLLAIERADSSMKLMMQVRNKVLDAYREIMRMQV
jgi:flagellar hook-basal body complex protein FliE